MLTEPEIINGLGSGAAMGNSFRGICSMKTALTGGAEGMTVCKQAEWSACVQPSVLCTSDYCPSNHVLKMVTVMLHSNTEACQVCGC